MKVLVAREHKLHSLTLTVTFHHPEQSLLHKLHWLDHVIRVGVFSVSCARPEHLIMYLGKETSTLGITGLTFLRIASP